MVGHDLHDATKIRQALTTILQGWAPKLLGIINVADEHDMNAWNLYLLPAKHRWQGRLGVTRVGGTALLMIPFAGQSAILAVEDIMHPAYVLFDGLTPRGGHALSSDRKFEAEIFERIAAQKLVDMAFQVRPNRNKYSQVC